MRFFFPLVIIFTLAALGFYAWLGGLQKPTVKVETTAAPVYLAGQAFSGPANADAFGPLFRQAKDAVDHGQLKGDLANLFFNNPESAHDTVQAFVGVAVADTTSQPLPAGFRYRAVPAGQRIVAARLRGVSFMLAPGKLYSAALDTVKARKLHTRNLFLERFGAAEASEVWVGVE
jgi:hypothetical protein